MRSVTVSMAQEAASKGSHGWRALVTLVRLDKEFLNMTNKKLKFLPIKG